MYKFQFKYELVQPPTKRAVLLSPFHHQRLSANVKMAALHPSWSFFNREIAFDFSLRSLCMAFFLNVGPPGLAFSTHNVSRKWLVRLM